jgi:hypothetical protein
MIAWFFIVASSVGILFTTAIVRRGEFALDAEHIGKKEKPVAFWSSIVGSYLGCVIFLACSVLWLLGFRL